MGSLFGNNIVFVGNSGVGKSYSCNRIFKLCKTTTRFESSCSISAVTENIQRGSIKYREKSLNIIDTPGFYDTNGYVNQRTDGENFCKLIKALETCNRICGIVFVFTDRFSQPHQIWFDRMIQLISPSRSGHIILLHNKTEKLTQRQIVENEFAIENMLKTQVSYVPFEMDGSDETVTGLLENIIHKMSFRVKINQIPEMCYERTEQGGQYDKIISERKTDLGQYVETVKDTSHWEIDEEKRRIQVAEDVLVSVTSAAYALLGGPIGWTVAIGLPIINSINHSNDEPVYWVTSQVTERKWVAKLVTEIVYGSYVDTFKVRYDGTKDKASTTEKGRRTVIH